MPLLWGVQVGGAPVRRMQDRAGQANCCPGVRIHEGDSPEIIRRAATLGRPRGAPVRRAQNRPQIA